MELYHFPLPLSVKEDGDSASGVSDWERQLLNCKRVWMLPSASAPRLNKISGDPSDHLNKVVVVIPVISSSSTSSSSSDMDLGGNPLQPPTSSTSFWASFTDPTLIAEPPSAINPSSQPLLLALLRDNLPLLPQLPNPILASIPLLFSFLLNLLDHTSLPTQPIVYLIGLIVFLSKEKLQIQMVNDSPSECRDTLLEPSDTWECFFRLFSQIQFVENEIHIWQLVLPGVRSKPSSLVCLQEFEQEIRCRQASLIDLFSKAFGQSFVIQELPPIHPFAYQGPGWFSGYQASYQGRVKALLQVMLSSDGHLV